jgi:uncharacterized membrane protein YhaH (DUF805 family)
MNWYLEVLRKYAVFGGRARRTEYWMFALGNVVVSMLLAFVDRSLGMSVSYGVGTLSSLYALAVLIPSTGGLSFAAVPRLTSRLKATSW